MTDRPTASTINDAQLDELYARIATLEHVAAGNKRHVQAIVPDLERAEAAIARVRALAEKWHAREQPHSLYAHDLRTALDGPAPTDTDTTQPEPATVTDPAWLCQQYAKAIAADDGHPWDTLTADRQESYLDNADAVMRVRDRHLGQLRQRLQLAAEWTPPPPGSTREQLPDHLLDLIRGSIPDYTSTACVTAGTLAVSVHLSHPRRAELWEHAERLHGRCRRNQKFTGQLCACRCHPTEEQS